MSDNSFSEAVKFTAPTSEATTAPVVADDTSADEEHPEPKTFTQEELDAIVSKEKAKTERRILREQREAAQQRPVSTEAPKADQFKTGEEYLEALSDWKADQKVAQRKQQEQQNKVESSFDDKMDQARAKYGSDFDAKMKTEGWYCSEVATQALKDSDLGPDIAYYLASNPEESKRIWDMNPVSQIREIGKIEAKLAANPTPVKKGSSAPAPITPVGARGTVQKFDTTDPRSDKMSIEDWFVAERKRLEKQARARQA